GHLHPSYLLSEQVLDVGNDDYYNHPGPWWDVRDSPWLAHLERPPGLVSVTVAGIPGTSQVLVGPLDNACTRTCAQRYDGGTQVRIAAFPQSGYRLILWGGGCS